ncbi:MAG: hypothetical protein ACRD8Z_23060 [Nitrososphaeraceae archaeon]
MIVAGITAILKGATALEADSAFASGHKKHYEESSSLQENDCGNGKFPLNVGCQNTASQIQGDKM